MREIDAEEPRKVPYHIDTDDRLGEAVIVFIVVFMLGNVVRTLAGSQENGTLIAFAVGIVCGICFYTFSLGKPKGYLLHRAQTMTGIPVTGLISPSIKRFRR